MESISITHPFPIVLRPPALGYPIENSPEEIAGQPETEVLVEQKEIEERKALQQLANAQAAIAGRIPNGPIDMSRPGGPQIIDFLV
jgi:hypothetical protein